VTLITGPCAVQAHNTLKRKDVRRLDDLEEAEGQIFNAAWIPIRINSTMSARLALGSRPHPGEMRIS